jgi:hypothetical protein
MYRRAIRLLILLCSLVSLTQVASAQFVKHKKTKPKPKSSISLGAAHSDFHPTYSLGSGSVGKYFYPQSVGSSWKLKIVQHYFDAANHILSSDSLYSQETVISNANKTFQGLPLVTCAARSWRANDEAHADSIVDAYYVDDSLVMAVFNNSINNNQNRVLLVSPLKVGNKWLEKTEDSARTEIATMHDTVNVPYGAFGNALVTVTKLGKIEMDKYFVPSVGIVKTVMRVPGRKEGETIVVTSELLELVRGIEAALPKDERPSIAPGSAAPQGASK